MNNLIGLSIALSLALVAGVLNWKYLDRKSDEVEMVSFLAIRDGVRLKPGDAFLEQHFVSLDIPRKNVGYLTDAAVLYRDRQTVVSMKAVHPYRGGDVILRQELKTPPEELKLASDELAVWIPVDGGSFVSSLVAPGDMVSFYVNGRGTLNNPGSSPPPDEAAAESTDQESVDQWNLDGSPQDTTPQLVGTTELIGPFRILSLGGRLGSYEVARASGESRGQENVMGIAVKMVGNHVDEKAERLLQKVNSVTFRQAGVLLHPSKKNK